MAEVYREKVTELAKALEDERSRPEVTEEVRGLVDAIVLTPDEGGQTLQIDLKGNLAAMLDAATNAKRSPETGDISCKL
jgi:hypothetical protein